MSSAPTRIITNARVHTPDGVHDGVVFTYRQGQPAAQITPRRGPDILATSPPVADVRQTGTRSFVVEFADGSEPWTVHRAKGCGCGGR